MENQKGGMDGFDYDGKTNYFVPVHRFLLILCESRMAWFFTLFFLSRLRIINVIMGIECRLFLVVHCWNLDWGEHLEDCIIPLPRCIGHWGKMDHIRLDGSSDMTLCSSQFIRFETN